MDGYGYNQNQYSTTSYGAQGGNTGGGFMAGGDSASPAGRSGYGKDTLRPCTIKQILDASQPHSDAEFKIDGQDVTQVSFVGQIRNVSTQTTNITYKLDDGTGTVEVKQWIDTDAAASDPDEMNGASGKPQLTEGMWVQVFGKLKAFSNKRHVGAHVIRPVTDLNEINHHLLQSTVVHLFFTRGPPGGSTAANNHADASAIANGAAVGAGVDAGFNGKTLPAGLSNMAKRVYQTLKNTPQDHEGLHVQNLAAVMGTGATEAQNGADELVQAGLIYTTVDDNTWAILDF